MDPRPYHFQFRRPRLSNPTYQSTNLYDSIYQLNNKTPPSTNPFPIPQNLNPSYNPHHNNYYHQKQKQNNPQYKQRQRYDNSINKSYSQSNSKQLRRNHSMQINNSKNMMHQNNDFNRYSSKIELPIVGGNEKNQSKLSSYGYNSMQGKNHIIGNGSTNRLRQHNNNPNKNNPPQHQQTVDQKQIFSKQQHAFNIINYQPTHNITRLKMFPKLTLQDKIYQRTGSPLKNQNS